MKGMGVKSNRKTLTFIIRYFLIKCTSEELHNYKWF